MSSPLKLIAVESAEDAMCTDDCTWRTRLGSHSLKALAAATTAALPGSLWYAGSILADAARPWLKQQLQQDDVCDSTDSECGRRRRVRFQAPVVIEVASWKQETKQMHFRPSGEEDEEADVLEEALALIVKKVRALTSSRFTKFAACAMISGGCAIGVSMNSM
eukprot:TRINITY_DN95058_c0_g1_i1.p2 TRINITY_DN95058_c0_g1~~TRINITY_DN95058_c0_g1_i1.p2  ORF type:complete len:163 (-),score=33.34 TRINITY_DN95058_c0_g1_i1:97-585(-)